MAETAGPIVGMEFRFDNDGDTQVPVMKIAGEVSLPPDVQITTNESEGVDSLTNELPANFGSYPKAYGYTGEDLTTITVTVGADSYVKTFTYSSGVLTAESMWVKQ